MGRFTRNLTMIALLSVLLSMGIVDTSPPDVIVAVSDNSASIKKDGTLGVKLGSSDVGRDFRVNQIVIVLPKGDIDYLNRDQNYNPSKRMGSQSDMLFFKVSQSGEIKLTYTVGNNPEKTNT